MCSAFAFLLLYSLSCCRFVSSTAEDDLLKWKCERLQQEENVILSDEEIDEYKLWAHFTSKSRYVEDTLDFFDAGFRKLYQHQNPVSCKDATFLLEPGHGMGFGSNIHMETVFLSMAINTGRVLLRDPMGRHQARLAYLIPSPYRLVSILILFTSVSCIAISCNNHLSPITYDRAFLDVPFCRDQSHHRSRNTYDCYYESWYT